MMPWAGEGFATEHITDWAWWQNCGAACTPQVALQHRWLCSHASVQVSQDVNINVKNILGGMYGLADAHRKTVMTVQSYHSPVGWQSLCRALTASARGQQLTVSLSCRPADCKHNTGAEDDCGS